jgi:hypothetical protein
MSGIVQIPGNADPILVISSTGVGASATTFAHDSAGENNYPGQLYPAVFELAITDIVGVFTGLAINLEWSPITFSGTPQFQTVGTWTPLTSPVTYFPCSATGQYRLNCTSFVGGTSFNVYASIASSMPQGSGGSGGGGSVTQGTVPWVVSFQAPQHVIVDSGGGGGVQYADNAASGATPTGTLASGWDSVNSKIRALKVDPSQNLLVDVSNASIAVTGTFFQATQPVSIAANVGVTQQTSPWVISFTAPQHVIVDSGSLTANQGTAAAVTAGWPVIGGQLAETTASWTSATTVNTALALTVIGYNTVAVSLNQGTTITGGVVTFEVSDTVAGTNWYPIQGAQEQSFVSGSTYTLQQSVNQGYSFDVSGWVQFRVRLSTVISGTGTVAVGVIAQAAACESTVTIGGTVTVGNATLAVTQSTSPWVVSLTSTTITGTVAVTQSTSPWVDNLTQVASTVLGTPQSFGTAPTGVVIGTSSDIYVAGTRARSNQTTTAAGVQDVNVVGVLGVTSSVTNGLFASITDGTTKAGVIVGTTALKTDLSSVAGTATVTAAAGVQKVGITGNANATLDQANGSAVPTNGLMVGGGSVAGGTNFTVLTVKAASTAAAATDTALVVMPLVGSHVMNTAAAGTQLVGIVGNAAATLDQANGSAVPTNGLMVGGGSVAGGTNFTVLTVKAASVAAAATDTSLVVQPLVGSHVMNTAAAGTQLVGIVGNAAATLDSAINTGAASTNAVWTEHAPASPAAAACTPKFVNASGAAVNLKATAGNLYGVVLTNSAAAVTFAEFFNTSGTPVLGTTAVVMAFAIPASATLTIPIGAFALMNFSTGIGFAATTVENGTTAVAVTGGVFFV